MATQNEENTEVIEDIENQDPATPPEGGEAGGENVEAGEESNELTEPTETDYADPAEYRKALREYDRKLLASEIKTQYEKQNAGILNDLKKARNDKFMLRQQIQQLAESQGRAAQQPPVAFSEPEPLPQSFETPASYAKAWAQWDAKKNAVPQPQANHAAQPNQQGAPSPEDAVILAEWNGKLQSASTNPAFVAAQQKIQSEGIGQFIGNQALRQIMVSPIGTSIYQYLAENPSFAEEVEDASPKDQVMKIRILESNLMTGKVVMRAPENPPVGGVVQAVKPKAPPPPAPKPAAPPPPAPKNRTQAKSMEEYARLRKLEMKKKSK